MKNNPYLNPLNGDTGGDSLISKNINDNLLTINLDNSCSTTPTIGYISDNSLRYRITEEHIRDTSIVDIFNFLPEDMIDTVFKKIESYQLSGNSLEKFKQFITAIVMDKKCSQEFLLYYYDYVDPNIIFRTHSEKIMSDEYAVLRMRLMEDDHCTEI